MERKPPFRVRWTDTFDNSSNMFGSGPFDMGPAREFQTFDEAFAFAEKKGGTMFVCCVIDADDAHLSCSGKF